MAWAWAYLVVSVLGAVLVANAFRPSHGRALLVPSFFAGWYTNEMAIWHIVWQVAATVVFGVEGALGSWPGWVGLAVNALAWAGLARLAQISSQSRHVLDRVAEELALPVDEGVILPLHGGETMWRFPRLVYPLPRPARSVTVVRNIDYVGEGRRAQRLDIIRRRLDPPGAGPVLVHIHGGAWILGDKREQGFPLMHELARHGWVCVTINYRLSPKATWPDHIVDCKRAVAWVRDHIAQYGGDPGFIAVTGGSAGGHLSALLALTAGDPAFQPGFEAADASVDAAAPFYGIYDLTPGRGTAKYDEGLMRFFERMIFKRRYEDDPELFTQASPTYRVHEGAPPFFVVHGRNDTLAPVADARRFVEALRQVSSEPVAYAELPYAQHAFDVMPSVRTGHTTAAVLRFLEGVRSRNAREAQAASVPDPIGSVTTGAHSAESGVP